MGAQDAFLLDAYSQTVSGVVEQAGPSVAAVKVKGHATDRDAPLGGGSGFLFTPDGYLLSNSHVVRAGANERPTGHGKRYTVSLSDGREFEARFVGDDTAIIRGAQSISFAVAIDIAGWVIPQLLQHGRVRRGHLGVGGLTTALDRRIVLAFGLTQTHAVRVSAVERDSPAGRAGLYEGDLIIGLDGVTIDSVDRLHPTPGARRVHRDCVLKG